MIQKQADKPLMDKTEITFDKTAIATVVNQKAQSEKESADSDTKQKMEIEDEKK